MSKKKPDPGKSILKALEAGDMEAMKAALQSGYDPDACTEEKGSGVTLLMRACELGSLEAAKLLVEHGASTDKKSIFGNTALMYAAGSGNIELMRWLVSLGADVRETDNYGYSVLLMAARSGSLECLKFCAGRGLDFREKGCNDITPLMVAGSIDVARYMVQEHGVNINDRSIGGGTALMYAASRNDPGLVGYLLEKGAEVDAREKDVTGSFGKTALHYAADKGSLDIVRLLVEAGADRSIKAKYGETAMDFAVAGNHRDVIEYLLSVEGDGEARHSLYALLSAAERGTSSLSLVKHLVEEKGASVNGTGDGGVTPLMKAAAAESPEVVEYLISMGASLTMKDSRGRMAIDYVAKEPPEKHENAHEAWCHSRAGEVIYILEDHMNA